MGERDEWPEKGLWKITLFPPNGEVIRWTTNRKPMFQQNGTCLLSLNDGQGEKDHWIHGTWIVEEL